MKVHYKNNKKASKNKFKPKPKYYHCGKQGHLKKDCFIFKRSVGNAENQNLGNKQAKVASTQSERGFAFIMRQVVDAAKESEVLFILDSGASDYIVKDTGSFSEFVNLETPVEISIATRIVQLSSSGNQITLEDVLYSKDIRHKLLSVKKMQDAGIKGVKVTKNVCLVLDGNCEYNVPIIKFEMNHKAYVSKMSNNEEYRLGRTYFF